MAPSDAWAYLNDQRTHEVRIELERGRTLDLLIRETAGGGALHDEVYVERHTLSDPFDAKLRTLALETRLALLGNYYKRGPRGWTPVRLAQPRAPIDLRPIDVDGGDAIEFHHFAGEGRSAVSLVSVHTPTPRGRRTLLVRLDYAFPDTDGGRLDVVHAKLPPVLYRSALASQHLALAERGYGKASPEDKRIGDSREWKALRATLDAILARLAVVADAKADILLDPGGRALDARALAIVSEASRAIKGAASQARAYEVEYEVDGPATSVEARKPDVTMEALSADVFAALREPRLLALHARFMPPGAEEELFARGERAILAHARRLREGVRPDEYHLISLLEASLLLRYALKNRVPVDPNVIQRVRHARAYL